MADAPLHRRHHRKADGRDLWLYGRAAHDLSPIAEPERAAVSGGGEWRWHPLRRVWSIYAAHRQHRPMQALPGGQARDPLAPSTEGGPVTEIPFTDFDIAVFDNRFPGLHPAPPAAIDGVAIAEPGRGKCEVVVYTPEAQGSLASLTQERRQLLVDVWVDRYRALFDDGHIYVLPFENRGAAVGVTLHHPHGQIYAFDRIPPVQVEAMTAFVEGYDLAADLARWQDFVITEQGGIQAVCPPYARFPYEVWLVPQRALPGPWDMTPDERSGFAALLGDITARYDRLFGEVTPYMLSLHAAPRDHAGPFHFTAQFYPLMRAPGRLKYLASVEQSTGIFTVDVLPEAAAQALRAA